MLSVKGEFLFYKENAIKNSETKKRSWVGS